MLRTSNNNDCNGNVYSKSQEYDYTYSTNNPLTWIIRILFVLMVIGAILWIVNPVHALAYVTPLVQNWTESAEHSKKHGNSLSGCELIGGYNAEIITCDLGNDDTKVEKDSEEPTTSIVENAPIVELVTNEPIVQDESTIEEPAQDNEPVQDTTEEPAEKEHTDNGNHYGNDNKPDNNDHDDKNKHDGCDSQCTGQDVK